METDELKFLLKLLGCPNYRTSLTASGFKALKGKDKICQKLGELELVDYSREIASAKILAPGRALLKLDTSQLPITDEELKVLEKIGKASGGKIKPSEIKILKASERETILKNLAERGLIEAENKLKKQKAEVWLTQRGQEYLQDEYNPKGSATISLDLLKNYLSFLRKSLRVANQAQPTDNVAAVQTSKPTDEEILQTIRDLDRELGTDNYLPIFHLRQKLQPPLSREELDKALYRLQRNDQIELSSLVDPTPYTSEQVDAGILKDVGGRIFFIVVN